MVLIHSQFVIYKIVLLFVGSLLKLTFLDECPMDDCEVGSNRLGGAEGLSGRLLDGLSCNKSSIE